MILELSEEIGKYPHLRQCLGERWIAREMESDAVWSEFSLARWLRIPGYEPTLEVLERILERFNEREGMAERRRAIRNDPSGFRETLCELYVADWLIELGYQFDMPKRGPDFKVFVGSESVPLEVTAPRRVPWRDDVRDRLQLLAMREDVHFDLTFTDDPTPADVPPETAIHSIIDTALELIDLSPRQGDLSVSRELPNLFLTLAASRNRQHYFTISSTYAAAVEFGAFALAANAAIAKADQFVEGVPNILMVCIDQMTDEDTIEFMISYRTPSTRIPINWNEMPRDLGHLVVANFASGGARPDPGRWISNPHCPHAPSPEAVHLLHAMFPAPLPEAEE